MSILIVRLTSAILLVFGAITFPLPLPTGAVAIALGLALLASTSPRMLNWLRTVRTRYRVLDRKLDFLEKYVPESIKKTIRESRPEPKPSVRG